MNKNTIEQISKKSCEDYFSQYSISGVPSSIKDIKGHYQQAFEAGAEWRINSVWHDNKELPEVDKPIIVQVMGKVDIARRIYKDSGLIIINRTVDMTPFGNVTKWAYIEDLLPVTIK